MKAKTLGILVLVLAVLCALIALKSRRPRAAAEGGVEAGKELLVGIDINAVSKVEIASGSATTVVERKEGKWRVASLHDYPADFAKLAQELRRLADMKAGQVMRGGTSQLDEYGLADGFATNGSSARLTLSDASGSPLAVIRMGAGRQARTDQPYGGFVQGQFIRVGEGPVVLVEESLEGLPREASGWIDPQLLDVNSSEVVEIASAGGPAPFTLDVKGVNSFALKELGPQEELDTAPASRLAGALQGLRCASVADPSLGDEATGLSTGRTVSVRTREGRTYTLRLGKEAEANNRYLKIAVAYAEPPEPVRADVERMFPAEAEKKVETPAASTNDAPKEPTRDERIQQEFDKRLAAHRDSVAANKKRAEEEQAKLGFWTYVVAGYTCEPLLFTKDNLVKKIEKKEEPPASAAGAKPEEAVKAEVVAMPAEAPKPEPPAPPPPPPPAP
jgi:hypothetical protein